MAQLRIDQLATITASFADVKGNSATPTVTPVWTIANSTLATVSASADGLTATITPTGILGATTVSIAHGAITNSADLQFIAGLPVTVTLNATVA